MIDVVSTNLQKRILLFFFSPLTGLFTPQMKKFTCQSDTTSEGNPIRDIPSIQVVSLLWEREVG